MDQRPVVILWCLGCGLSVSSVWLFWVDSALLPSNCDERQPVGVGAVLRVTHVHRCTTRAVTLLDNRCRAFALSKKKSLEIQTIENNMVLVQWILPNKCNQLANERGFPKHKLHSASSNKYIMVQACETWFWKGLISHFFSPTPNPLKRAQGFKNEPLTVIFVTRFSKSKVCIQLISYSCFLCLYIQWGINLK